jgi:hypothetical protein
MSTPNKINARQIISSDVLAKIALAAGTTVQDLLKSLNSEVTSPFQILADSPNDLGVTIGSSRIKNPITSLSHTVAPIAGDVPLFTSGTIVFPSTSGGNAVCTPGNNSAVVVASGQWIKATIYLDATLALNVLTGTAGSTEALATTAAAPSGTIAIGYVSLQNVGGVIQNITNSNIYQFVGTGSGGSGSGSGTGDDLDSLLFRASFNDSFSESGISSASSVNIAAGNSNAVYSAVKSMWQMSYDAGKTVTATGTAFTLSSAPSFTIAVGDLIIIPGVDGPKKIATLSSQTVGTIESAWTTNPTAVAACVSQAVITKDIYNLAVDGTSLASAFGSSTFGEILVDYKDNSTSGSNLFTPNTTPSVAFAASPDNTNFTISQTRATNETDLVSDTLLPSSGTSLYLRFFANKTSGNGVVNLINYRAFMQKSSISAGGGVLNAAYGFTNSVGTPVNSTVSVVGGKTTIKLVGFSYAVGVGSSARLPYGSVDVIINGQFIPRFIDSTVTPDASYLETSPTVITLDRDYSGINLSYMVLQRSQIVDASSQNTTLISSLQEVNAQGFQSFVNTANQVSPTTLTGTPASGSFYSTITNRAKIIDPTQDLKVSNPMDRIEVQSLMFLQNEYGTNGEAIWAPTNDDRGLIRFGGFWSSVADNYGQRAFGNTLGNFIEITFYGSGLNLLTFPGDPIAFNWSVDGGSTTAISLGLSTILGARNYSSNQIVPIVSGLTVGMHTVRLVTTNANNWSVFGCEILNPTTSLSVNPGTAYVGGQKIVSASVQTQSYNSGFDSGTLGTVGGHVVVYAKADGTIGKAVTPTNASAAYGTSADHTNEEMHRSFASLEFGAARTDDFTLSASTSNYAFTLDDGVTSLNGSSINPQANFQNIQSIGFGASSFVTFTFVGTGCDVFLVTSASSTGALALTVDNVSQGTVTLSTAIGQRLYKIASGLPFGTHTVKLAVNTATNFTLSRFNIYQPKKPSVPTGAIELTDFNIPANYVGTTNTAGLLGSQGIIQRMLAREHIYSGTWAFTSLNPDIVPGGFDFRPSTNGAYAEYTFVGTGFAVSDRGNTTSNWTLTLDGSSNFSGNTVSKTATGTFTASTGTYTGAINTGYVAITGLTFGKHTVRITFNDAASVIYFWGGFQIITPIYSARSNTGYDQQNTLTLGSLSSMSDNRKTSAVKESYLQKKNVSQAFGILSGPTTTSTSYVPMPDLSVMHTNNSGKVRITFRYQGFPNSAMNMAGIIYMDGSPLIGSEVVTSVQAASYNIPVGNTVYASITPGPHKFDVYWSTSGGTMTNFATQRNLLVEEA